jgi:hypothetical protein
MPVQQSTSGLRWNKVTWYSKLGAIILFVGVVPALCFYIGEQYELTQQNLENPALITPTTSSGNDTALQVATTSLDYACTKGSGAICDGAKLTGVLETRAANPQYVAYVDPATGISFQYPSSVSTVHKEVSGGVIAYRINPIMPAPVYSEYWQGVSIYVIKCDQTCPSDLVQYIKNQYAPVNSKAVDQVSNISSNVISGQNTWTKATIDTAIGGTVVLYVSVGKGEIISLSPDTENFTTLAPNIASAFHKILETLTF